MNGGSKSETSIPVMAALLPWIGIPTTLMSFFHHVTLWDEESGDLTVYEDGEIVAEGNTPIRMSDLNDVNNWLGRSNWTNDANAAVEYEEFRIYSGLFDQSMVLANMSAGPDEPPGDDPDRDGDGMPNVYEDMFAFLNPDDPQMPTRMRTMTPSPTCVNLSWERHRIIMIRIPTCRRWCRGESDGSGHSGAH